MQNILECIEAEYRLVQSYHVFPLTMLANLKKTRLELEHQLQDSSQPSLQVVNDYIEHLEGYFYRIRRKVIGNLSEAFVSDNLRRLKFLHEIRLSNFGSYDVNFLTKFLKFCNDNEKMEDAKLFFVREYQNDIDIWNTAADIISKDFQNSRIAVEFLTAALNYNSGNELFYKKILKIELDAASRSSRVVYVEKCMKRLVDLLKRAFAEEHSERFYLDVLDSVIEYTFTTTLQNFVSSQIILVYPNSPDVWHKLAQVELLEDDVRISGKIASAGSGITDPSTKFMVCVQRYTIGLYKISAAAKPQLWFLYIDFLINASLNCDKYDKVLKYNSLKKALENGYEFISEDQYLAWIKQINELDAVDIIRTALKVHPTSVNLWRARMHYETLDENEKTVKKIFLQGKEVLKENSLLLWESYLNYHILYSSKDKVRAIYEEGINEHENISNKLKPQFLEWLASIEGIEPARDFYARTAIQPPYCKQLHFAMLHLEEIQVLCDIESIESILNLVCDQFKNDLDVWLWYVRFKETCFNFLYKDVSKTEHLVELKGYLKAVCKKAKGCLQVNEYAELKLHCLGVLQA